MTLIALSQGFCMGYRQVGTAAPMVCTAAPMVCTADPMVGTAAPMVYTAAPMVGTAAPMGCMADLMVMHGCPDGLHG